MWNKGSIFQLLKLNFNVKYIRVFFVSCNLSTSEVQECWKYYPFPRIIDMLQYVKRKKKLFIQSSAINV